jgi:ABC-type transporter Mla maintaining outer membrane lipid asymmetry ATPase subunit MlaF
MPDPAPNKDPAVVIEMLDAGAVAMREAEVLVAEGVRWTVHSGDFWVVAGLQGAGKSDFLMMTAGVMPPSSGQYRLFGEEMPIFEESRLGTRLRLGLVFDGGQLFNHLTILENVSLPLSYHQEMHRDQADELGQALLEALGLAAFAHNTPGSIGRNWRQRAGLARALTLKPEVLLVDSPLTGLDPWHTSWWLGFLDQLAHGHALLDGKPMTLIVTADDLTPWETHATQFAVLKDKRFLTLGTWAQIEAEKRELVRDLLVPGKKN